MKAYGLTIMMTCPPTPAAYSMPRTLEWMVSLRASHAWIFVLLCLDLAVLGDVVTGKTLWFGPGYLLVMCLAAWCLGWRAGLIIGFSCTALTLAVNGIAFYPHGDVDLLRNFIGRFIAIACVIAVVAGARRAYLREWWLARSDPLTGAFNRQAFFELVANHARSRKWRVLFFADLDGMKGINDAHGHAAGDLALKAFADVVRRNIRRNDLFARIGGDEFLVFMSIQDEASGVAIAQRLHTKMNSVAQQQGGFSRCSLGALLIAPGERQIDELIRQADAAMYRAKLAGTSLELAIAEDRPITGGADRFRKGPRGPLGLAKPAGLLPNIALFPSRLFAPLGPNLGVEHPELHRQRRRDDLTT